MRDATPDDAALIARLLIQAKEESIPELIDNHDRDFDFWSERWRKYLAEGSTAQQALRDGFAILALINDQPVGFAGYHHTRRHNCDAELESIYVLLEYQRCGAGTKLFAEVMRRLRADGATSVCVGYAPQNPYKQFYLKHGAVEIDPHWAVWRTLPAVGRA